MTEALDPDRRRLLTRLVGAGMLAGAGFAVPHRARAADTWPARPIRIIAPVAPGGGVDLVARTMADRLGRVLRQPCIVDNVSGGGGSIAALAAARAAPDGYTLMLGYVGTHGTNPAVRKLPYDAVADFTAIGMIGATPNVLVVHPELPVKTVADLAAYAKSRPGQLSYGSAGPGTLTHLVMEEWRAAAGLTMVHVPYRGIGPALTDLMGAQVQTLFPGLAAALPHLRAGRIRALAVTGRTRHPLLPAVPTLGEAGYAGFDAVQWYGIVGPARLPAPIVNRLNTQINAQISLPELKARLSSEAIEPMPMSPAQFAAYIRDDIAHWTRLAREQHIEVD